MTDIRDNPPPLPEPDMEVTAGRTMRIHSVLKIRQIEAAAFSRGVAAGQAEIDRLTKGYERSLADGMTLVRELDELRAKLKALEEQPAIAVVRAHGDYQAQVDWLLNPCVDGTLLFLAAGAKHD